MMIKLSWVVCPYHKNLLLTHFQLVHTVWCLVHFVERFPTKLCILVSGTHEIAWKMHLSSWWDPTEGEVALGEAAGPECRWGLQTAGSNWYSPTHFMFVTSQCPLHFLIHWLTGAITAKSTMSILFPPLPGQTYCLNKARELPSDTVKHLTEIIESTPSAQFQWTKTHNKHIYSKA